MSRGHSRVSPSGAERWMACTRAPAYEAQFPDKSTTYADEGTLAHSLAELKLLKHLGKCPAYEKQHKAITKDKLYAPEMDEHTSRYADYVIEKYHEALSEYPEAELSLEGEVDLGSVIPGGRGYCDAVIITDKRIAVFDLKYGKGVPVSAIGNPQLRLYGYGAYKMYDWMYDFQEVSMTICQPRLDSISEETLAATDLLIWIADVRPLAKMAVAGEGEFKAGEHCRWCKGAGACRARAEQNIEQAKADFLDETEGDKLTAKEIGKIMQHAAKYAAWYAALQDYAFTQARDHGVKFPGWKLVEGRSNRKYTDEDKVIGVLKDMGYKPKDYIIKKLKGITDMQKLLGKTGMDAIAEFITKPPGKPALVEESDSRPEYSSAAEDFKEGDE